MFGITIISLLYRDEHVLRYGVTSFVELCAKHIECVFVVQDKKERM